MGFLANFLFYSKMLKSQNTDFMVKGAAHVFVAFFSSTLALPSHLCKRPHEMWRHLKNMDCSSQILQIPPPLENRAILPLPFCYLQQI